MLEITITTVGILAIIGYMFNALTPTNRNKLPNLKGKYRKTLIGAWLIGAATVAALVLLGLI